MRAARVAQGRSEFARRSKAADAAASGRIDALADHVSATGRLRKAIFLTRLLSRATANSPGQTGLSRGPVLETIPVCVANRTRLVAGGADQLISAGACTDAQLVLKLADHSSVARPNRRGALARHLPFRSGQRLPKALNLNQRPFPLRVVLDHRRPDSSSTAVAAQASGPSFPETE